MLEPNKDKIVQTKSKIQKAKNEENSVEQLKEKVKILVETPMLLNSDFL